MNKTLCIALALTLAAPAFAADAPKMTIQECMDISSGLNALNGYVRLVNESAVQLQYKLGKSRMAVALNILALKPFMESAESSRQAIIINISDGLDLKAGTREALEFTKRYKAEVLDQPCPVTLARLSMKDLNPGDEKDQNPIPPITLGQLKPITDE